MLSDSFEIYNAIQFLPYVTNIHNIDIKNLYNTYHPIDCLEENLNIWI